VVIVSSGFALLLPPVLEIGGADPYALRLSVPFVLLAAATVLLPRMRELRVLAATGASLTVPASVWLWMGAQSVLASAAYLALVAASVWAWTRIAPTGTSPRLRIACPSWPVLGVAIAGGAAIWAGAWLLPAEWLGRWASFTSGETASWWAATIIGCAALAAAQELQFRGVLLGALECRWATAAIPLQAMAFGLAHLAAPGAISGVGPLVGFLLVVVALGVLWGWIAQRTDSLLPSWVMHTVALVFLATFVVGAA
jgi:membrane protease YdiL (CAAX protease family)